MNEKGEKIVTPRGTIKFPELEDDNWTAALSFDPKGNEKFVSIVDAWYEQEKVKSPFKEDQDKAEDGTRAPNGRMLINFKSKFDFPCFDSVGKDLKLERKDIGWDSEVQVSILFKPYSFKGKPTLPKYCLGMVIYDLKKKEVDAEALGFKFGEKTADDLKELFG